MGEKGAFGKFLMPKLFSELWWTLLQTYSDFDGYYYYYYYYYCFIFTFDLWCQNSAGQLCVVSIEMTLH